MSSLSYESCAFDISIQISSTSSRGFRGAIHHSLLERKNATIEVSDVHMIYKLIAKAYKVSKYYDNNPQPQLLNNMTPSAPTFPGDLRLLSSKRSNASELIVKAHKVTCQQPQLLNNMTSCHSPDLPQTGDLSLLSSRILLSLFLLVTHRSCCDNHPLTSFRIGLIRPNWATSVKANNLMYGRMEEESEIKAILLNLVKRKWSLDCEN